MERVTSSSAACCASSGAVLRAAKTLSSAGHRGVVGAGARPLVAKTRKAAGVSLRSRPGAPRATGLNFNHDFAEAERPKSTKGKQELIFSESKGLVGLNQKQIAMLGLTGEQDFRRPVVDQFSISAKAAYAKEMPSESNPPASMTTALAGGGGGVTMSAGGMAPAGAVAPPDLPSLLLNARIVYIGMPLVPAVTELIVAELLYCNYEQVQKPVYVYIHSPGSVNEKGEVVGMDNEAYAILDTMRYIKPKVHTVCVGKCFGNAAMLLASGDKGCRHALPHAQIMTSPPRLNRTFDTAVNVQIRANEVDVCEQTYFGFMSEFTEKSDEEVRKDLSRTRYFTPQTAIEYGLIDKIITKGSGIMENKDYETMLKAQQANQGGRGMPAAAGGAM